MQGVSGAVYGFACPGNCVGVIAVTCRKALENAAVLEKPSCVATREIGVSRARLSIACTMRARCRQALKVSPVSFGNSRLTLRIEVAARALSSCNSSRTISCASSWLCMGMRLPIGLGSEIAGTIEQLGQGAGDLKAGDAVSGIIRSGVFADYAIARAVDMALMPAGLDFIEAAVPLGALTAWQALFGLAGLQPGQRLFITNGAGGVGLLAVQIARSMGAHVTAMASNANEAYVCGLGADDGCGVRYGRRRHFPARFCEPQEGRFHGDGGGVSAG